MRSGSDRSPRGGRATQGVFACPECGFRIDLQPHSVGRQVRCSVCNTLVEVPFFPRDPGRKARRRRRRWIRCAVISGVVATAFMAGLIGWKWHRSAIRSEQEARLAATIEDADSAESRGEIASAFQALEAASLLVEQHDLEPPGGHESLRARRDDLARREAEARIESLDALGPDLAMDEARAIRDRLESDPALEPMARWIGGQLDRTTRRWLEHHRARLDALDDDGRYPEAMALIEQMDQLAGTLPPPIVNEVRGKIRDDAGSLVERAGVQMDPITVVERYDPNIEPDYDRDLLPVLASALADRGYLLPPESTSSPFADLWDRAPYRFRGTITERPGPGYFQSPHRTAQLSADLTLSRQGNALWRDHIPARTRVPLPGLNALESSRLAVSDRPSPELERRLYDDARRDLIDKLGLKLTRLPEVEGRQYY